ncbi:MAG: efflux RND transporter periplasmic adaptor subunit [Acidobacteriota bacterium]|nr:efflux RND transporter periplasmic adaptor subunit [Acidobacteriota bacterium]
MSWSNKRVAATALLLLLAAALGYGAAVWMGSRPASSPPAAAAPGASTPAGGHEQPAGNQPSTSEASGTVELTDAEQKAIGVETSEVRLRTMAGALETVGRVEEAETRLATISARVGGRIDKLSLDFTGQDVRRGQTIALIYSPEVASAAEEYKLALESVERLGSQGRPEAQAQARDLVTASRRRLELWGLAPQQIQEIAKADHPPIQITIHSTVSGTVMERKVTEGQYVKEGDALYTVADLSTVWVKADVYESDLARVRAGQPVEITSEALPGKLRGRVDFIEPTLNPQTRTVAVRIQVANPGLRLRPGMFVHASLARSAGQQALAVPRSAVLDTGTRKLVYIARGNGVFEPRPVELGAADQEFYPVLSGLKEGERVVTHGSFLMDSQTRLSGGMAGMFGGSKEFSANAPPTAPGAAAAFHVAFQTAPEPAAGKPADLHVAVTDAGGKAVSDAQVRVTLLMPAMPAMGMAETRQSAELKWDGTQYSGSMTIPTAGSWNVTVEVSRNGQRVAVYRTNLRAK